jgi:plasmid maintenance system antidote protein VapI
MKKLNINCATATEIAHQLNINKGLAARIVSKRRANTFTSLSELTQIKGISKEMLSEWQSLISLEDADESDLIAVELKGRTVWAKYDPAKVLDPELDRITEADILERGSVFDKFDKAPTPKESIFLTNTAEIFNDMEFESLSEDELNFLAWRMEEVDATSDNAFERSVLESLADIQIGMNGSRYYVLSMSDLDGGPQPVVLFASDSKDAAYLFDIATEVFAALVGLATGIGGAFIKKLKHFLGPVVRKLLKDPRFKVLLEELLERMAKSKAGEFLEPLRAILKLIWNQYWTEFVKAVKKALNASLGAQLVFWVLLGLGKWIARFLSAGAAYAVEIAAALGWLGVKVYRHNNRPM